MVIDRELGIAAERVGQRLETMFFSYSDDADHILRGASHHKQLPALANKRQVVVSEISAKDFMLQVLQASAGLANPLGFGTLVAVGFAVLPSFFRLAVDRAPAPDGLDTAGIIVTALISFIMFRALLAFLSAAYADFRRRSMSMLALSMVLSDNLRDHAAMLLQKQHTLSAPEQFLRKLDLPIVDMTVPANVTTWIVLMEIAQVNGYEYKRRIAANNTIIAFIIVGFMLTLIIQLLAGSDIPPVTLAYAIYFSFSMGYFLLLMASRGVEYNQQFAIMTRSLIALKIRLLHSASSMLTHLPSYTRIKNSTEMIDAAVQAISIEQQVNPATIIGLSATPSTLRGLAGVAFSVAAFVFQLVLKTN